MGYAKLLYSLVRPGILSQGVSSHIITYGFQIADDVIDPLLYEAGLKEHAWWGPNHYACAERSFTAANVRKTYIMVCSKAFTVLNGMVIGPDNRKAHWEGESFRFRQISFWREWLSYHFVHEFIHFLFHCEY